MVTDMRLLESADTVVVVIMIFDVLGPLVAVAVVVGDDEVEFVQQHCQQQPLQSWMKRCPT